MSTMNNKAAAWLQEAVAPSNPGIKFPDATVGNNLVVGKITNIDTATTEDLNGGSSEKLVVMLKLTKADNVFYGVKSPVPNAPDIDTPCVVGEEYALWVRPRTSLARALAEAQANANVPSIDVGGTLAVSFTAFGEKKKANAPKLFIAEYEPPVKGISAGSLLD